MLTGIALIGTITAAVAAWFVNIVRTSATSATDGEQTDAISVLQRQVLDLTDEIRALRQEVRLIGVAHPALRETAVANPDVGFPE